MDDLKVYTTITINFPIS